MRVIKASVFLWIASVLSPALALAECRVHVPVKEFWHDSGYSIRFDFQAVLEPKGYLEVVEASQSDLVLMVSGQEVQGRIHRARAELSLGSLSVSAEKLCFTQWCGIQDYAAAFRKAYRLLARRLPVCH